jgi:hypothetical protein
MSHPTSLLSGQSRGKARLVRPHDRRRGRQGNETKPDDPALNAVPWRGTLAMRFVCSELPSKRKPEAQPASRNQAC